MARSTALLTFVLLAVIFATADARAWEWDRTFEGQITEGFRKYDRSNDTRFVSVYDTWGILASEQTLSEGGLLIEAKPEFRFVLSQAVSADLDDPSRITLEPPPRHLDLETVFDRGSNRQLYTAVEKLSISYAFDTAEVYVGRRPVSLGVLRTFPVWNKFTKPLPFQSALVQRSTSDGAGIRFQSDRFLFKALAVVSGPDFKKDGAYLFETTYFGTGFDVLLLGGNWWDERTLGVAFTTDIEGLGVKNEWVAFGFNEGGSNVEYQNGTGLEYSFGEKFTALAELLYLSQGVNTSRDRPLRTKTRFMPLSSRFYAYANGNYKFTPLWTGTLGALANLVDGSIYLMGSSSRSMSDNVDLNLEVNLPLGPGAAEFSQRSVFLRDDITLGYPLTAALSLKIAL